MPGKTYNLNGNKSGRSATTSSSLSVIKYEPPPKGVTTPYQLQTNITSAPVSDFNLLINNANEKGYVTSYNQEAINLQPVYSGVLAGSKFSYDVPKVIGASTTLGFAGEEQRFTDLIDKANTSSKPVKPLPPGNPNTYDWNLPPHKWSLPTQPTLVNKEHFDKYPSSARNYQPDKYRRGRLWWKATPNISVIDSNANTTALGSGETTRKYGFQFLWNPETFGTQVAVQLEATPTVQDRFLGVSGAFPATETVSFTVRLDRTNDFACAATKLNRPSNVSRTSYAAGNVISEADVEKFKEFYRPSSAFEHRNISMNAKLVDLFQRGTVADLEYLYKAINGLGPGGSGNQVEWMNGRGIKTADIGWLMPTLLHVDVGPLSYDGYVTNLQVNHVAFTPTMIPIRTDVTISINVLATASLTVNQA